VVVRWHRLNNSKYPTIDIFDDIASPEAFEAIYAMQARVNPRLRLLDVGEGAISTSEIPAGTQQVHSAIAPFVHVPVTPSRFSAGGFGVLYGASNVHAGLDEVRHHIVKHLSNVEGIAFDNIQLREYVFKYTSPLDDVTHVEEFHLPNDYSAPQAYGAKLWVSTRKKVKAGLQKTDTVGALYCSVRSDNARCIALFSPKFIEGMKQSRHYGMNYDPKTKKLSPANEIKTA
jgi:hypothetical protein